MLTKTSLSAIRTLTFLGLHPDDQPCSPRAIAQQLGESPTYLAKVVRHLVRAGILKARRGITGGVVLGRDPHGVTLLAIVEACQGKVLGDFCSETDDVAHICGLHRAGAELHNAIVGILSRWTLADLLACPGPKKKLAAPCWLAGAMGREGRAKPDGQAALSRPSVRKARPAKAGNRRR